MSRGPRICKFCGKTWQPKPPKYTQKWHDCQAAQEAKRLQKNACQRQWRAAHPDYAETLRSNRRSTGLYTCQSCGKPTHNRFRCPDCWSRLDAMTTAPRDCLGQELPTCFL